MYYFEKLAGYIDIYVMENYNYIQLDNETFLWGKQSIKVAERMGKMQENKLADGNLFEFWENDVNYIHTLYVACDAYLEMKDRPMV